jgi:hypothetical protein
MQFRTTAGVPAQEVARRLGGTPSGNGWSARCPAHDDNTPSLSIAKGQDGRVLLKCFAGCPQENVLAALGERYGITVAALFPRNGNRARGNRVPLTLAELAAAKALPVEFLESLGVEQAGDSVKITHYLVDGTPAARHQLRHSGNARFTWTGTKADGPLVPYGLNRRKPVEDLFLVEGASDVWTGLFYGLNVLGLPGADMAKLLELEHLTGIWRIFVWREPDEGGHQFVAGVAARLGAINYTGRLFELRPPVGIKDLSDLHVQRAAEFQAQLQGVMAAAVPLEIPPAAATDGSDAADARIPTQTGRMSQVEQLIKLADDLDYFHGTDGETPYVSVGPETWRVGSTAFRRWLMHAYHQKHKKVPGSQALNDAVGLLSARAQFDGVRHEVHVRIARAGDTIYLDLADQQRRVIQVTSDGWTVIADCPVHFVRPRGVQPLPVPEPGSTVDKLREYINVDDDDAWVLIVGWLLGAMNPGRPCPVLVLLGEQGSAKTTATRVVKRLLDPNVADDRTAPREERDLAIAARNSRVLAYDNISHLSDWLSDALCRIVTGAAHGTRKLYSDDDEMLFKAMRRWF